MEKNRQAAWTEPFRRDTKLRCDGPVLVSIHFVGLLELRGPQIAPARMQPLLAAHGFQKVVDLRFNIG